MSVKNALGVCINISEECKANARDRLRSYLRYVHVWEAPFDDALEVLDDWLAETRAEQAAEIERLKSCEAWQAERRLNRELRAVLARVEREAQRERDRHVEETARLKRVVDAAVAYCETMRQYRDSGYDPAVKTSEPLFALEDAVSKYQEATR